MAAELLLVNPRRKKRRKARASGGSRRRRRVTVMARNPRRKRRGGARRMSALQRKFFGGGRRKRAKRNVTVMNSNPRRRRRRSKLSIFRRNPSPLSNPTAYATDMVVPAVSGAVGGIAIDYLFANVASLANLSPMMGNVARLGLAALLGVGVGMVTDKKTGALVAGGAMTITVYDIASQYLQQTGSSFAPQTGVGRYAAMGKYVRMNGVRRMGRLKGNRPRRGMGWWSPARVSQMGRHVPN